MPFAICRICYHPDRGEGFLSCLVRLQTKRQEELSTIVIFLKKTEIFPFKCCTRNSDLLGLHKIIQKRWGARVAAVTALGSVRAQEQRWISVCCPNCPSLCPWGQAELGQLVSQP